MLEAIREVDWSELEATLVGALFVVPLVFFVLFVFAPRQIADSEGTWTEWAWRFVLYLIASIGSTALLSTV